MTTSGICQCGCGRQAPVVNGQQKPFFARHGRWKWRSYTVDRETGCWNWDGFVQPTGYGSIDRVGTRARNAHRAYYEERNGPVPEGLQLDHQCRNRRCVNPDHLQPVTAKENSRRRIDLKLNMEKASAIRSLIADAVPQRRIAAMFSISQSMVSFIARNERWV